MGNLGPGELMLILAIALIVFGPKKLPEMGKSIGKALREFNKARNDFMESLHTEPDYDDRRPALATADGPVPDTYATDAPNGRLVEYPEPLDEESADALPYGGEFHAVDGDSQPSFRTAQPEADPAVAANSAAHAGEGRA